ncbi:MAG: hypothetical protein A2X82_05220 [Geobacteraceae bacterium GWC2_55_20]|nr:MAG: hypothetical protein A2X82_05220 [Geobacteraceae bacterium GWC2_55_20]OGU25456.1 MAG: hypothetical protein A2X85_11765 [Geobacteraceae bacterium GWF2_54_21]HCE68985.1 hypothetical protein [Geobacter sp.]
MKWSSNDGEKLVGVSTAAQITEALNHGASLQGIRGSYYLKQLDCPTQIHVSNAPNEIFELFPLRMYSPPKEVTAKVKSLLSNLQENIDIFQNYPLDPSDPDFSQKPFRLNECYHNSVNLFHMVRHLDTIKAIKLTKPVKIVLGHVSSKIPFGTKVGNAVIESDSVWLHDWHVWNYVENVLIDMSMFKHGGIIPPDDSVTSWGKAQDHIFAYPPNNLKYYGVSFSTLSEFNNVFGKIFGIA